MATDQTEGEKTHAKNHQDRWLRHGRSAAGRTAHKRQSHRVNQAQGEGADGKTFGYEHFDLHLFATADENLSPVLHPPCQRDESRYFKGLRESWPSASVNLADSFTAPCRTGLHIDTKGKLHVRSGRGRAVVRAPGLRYEWYGISLFRGHR